MQHHFGEICNGIVGLSVPGCVAHYFWRDISHHQSNVFLDEFIIMPNHLHGIVGIKAKKEKDSNVRTLHATSVQDDAKGKYKNKMAEISPKAGSLSAIIRSYKSAVTKWCNAHDHAYFAWQSRFYDHIIRNDKELDNIRRYIYNNPMRWQIDRENKDGNAVHEQGVEYMVGR